MGWETTLMTHLRYNRKSYNNLSEVNEDLELSTETISRLKQELRDLAFMTEPEKWFKDDPEYGTPYQKLKYRVEDILEELDEKIIENYKLEILKDVWNKCHNEEGLAIAEPDNVHWDSSYLDGDYIKTTKDNG